MGYDNGKWRGEKGEKKTLIKSAARKLDQQGTVFSLITHPESGMNSETMICTSCCI
jgi:hypothetical protein